MKIKHEEYLGDGVYITFNTDRMMTVLTTGNHDPARADNVICLEPEVVIMLVESLARLAEKMKSGDEP